MDAIESILKELQLPYGYAATPNREGKLARCFPNTAYKFTNILNPEGRPKEAIGEAVVVECRPADQSDLQIARIVDHHTEGDPGYGLPAERYWKGSSLGQVCNLVGYKPTQELRVIAAADHCLRDAYQEKCPGITSKEVQAFRLPLLAGREGVSLKQAEEGIIRAKNLLRQNQSKITLAGIEVHDLRRNGILPFMVEAGIALNEPFLARVDSRPGNGLKVLLDAGGREEVTRAFLERAEELGVKDYYQARPGLAGGTQTLKEVYVVYTHEAFYCRECDWDTFTVRRNGEYNSPEEAFGESFNFPISVRKEYVINS